jgi:serine/threonine protein kinase
MTDDDDEREVGVTSDFADPLIGRDFVGKYRIRSKLGEGGFGTVYRAIQLAVEREVAVKVLRPDRANDERLRETLVKRFQREAMAMSKLGHPNTVQLIDFGTTDDDILFLVLELLDGLELSQIVATQAPMPPSRVSHVCRQICMSLMEAHSNGIIHRDLKPGNVFLCHVAGDDDFVKVMDFGIARVIEADDEQGNLTKTGMTQGTPAYMAPEQAMALKTTPASDLYSLGCMMYEMLTGEMPFTGDSSVAISLSHVNDEPPKLVIPGASPGLSRSWDELFRHLVEKKKKHRIQSAKELAERFEELEKLGDPGLEPSTNTAQEDKTELARPALEEPKPEDDRKTEFSMGGIELAPSDRTDLHQAHVKSPNQATRFLAFALLCGLAIVGLTVVLDTGTSKRQATSTEVAKSPSKTLTAQAHPDPNASLTARDPIVAASATAKLPTPSAPLGTAPAGPKLAHLVLASDPGGALVYRDYDDGEVLLCSTPCDIQVPAGEGVETLSIRAEGRLDKELRVVLSAGAQVVLALNLESKKRKRALRRQRAPARQRPRPAVPALLPAFRTGP